MTRINIIVIFLYRGLFSPCGITSLLEEASNNSKEIIICIITKRTLMKESKLDTNAKYHQLK